MLNPADFKQSIRDIDALGATPAVLLKVVALAKDPATSMSTICTLLRNDGPLAADIIRLSNSVYYSPATPHGNLTEAVNQIGTQELIWVINLSLARQLFARDLPSYGITARDYWSAAVAAALVMEGLARHLHLDPEDAHTIGILHGLGRILIDRVIEKKGFSVFWEGTQPIADWERASVGFDYAEAGAMLLDHWSFPPATCAVIRGQTTPPPADPHNPLLDALQFTQRLLELTGVDFEKEDWQTAEPDPFWEAHGLSPTLLAPLVADCRDDFKSIRQTVEWQ